MHWSQGKWDILTESLFYVMIHETRKNGISRLQLEYKGRYYNIYIYLLSWEKNRRWKEKSTAKKERKMF